MRRLVRSSGPRSRRIGVGIVAFACVCACACTPEPHLGAPAPADDGAGESSGSVAGSTTEVSDDASTTTPGPSGPPVVVDIGTNAATLTEGGAIVVTATVRDPDGDDDVTGGWLVLADAALDVAPFQRGESGRFVAGLDWSDLVRLAPPTFAATQSLRLSGRFTDRTGATAEGDTSVLLVCAGLSGAACEGACVDLESHDAHCGACGRACEIEPAPVGGRLLGGCAQSGCMPTLAACASAERFPDCVEVCAREGRRCATGCDGGYVTFTDDACTEGATQPGSTGCDPEPFGWPASGSVRCCCTAPD